MRVLHLDGGREMRGGQWQALRLMRGLSAAGIECSLLARKEAPLFRETFTIGSLRLANVRKCSGEVDLVHAHDARSHTLAAVAARAPVIVSRRVAFPIRSRWKYRQAAHYIAVSEFVRSALLEGGVKEDNISVVYDGVALDRPLSDLSSGAVVHEKDTTFALAAVQAAGIAARSAGNLDEDLKTASMLVYITASEGLGSGILLAMASGVPVIASKIGGIPEIIRHEYNGLLVGNTPEGVTAAVRRLLIEPELAALFRERGRKTVEQHFSEEDTIRNTMAVYEKVIQHR